MSDIYATAMREAAKSAEQKQEEAEERSACNEVALQLSKWLRFGAVGNRIDHVGGNIAKLLLNGREYRILVTGGGKIR